MIRSLTARLLFVNSVSIEAAGRISTNIALILSSPVIWSHSRHRLSLVRLSRAGLTTQNFNVKSKKEASAAIKKRKKDGVPDEYELIASVDLAMQTFVPLANYGLAVASCLVIPKALYVLYQFYSDLQPNQSWTYLPYLSEETWVVFLSSMAYIVIFTGLRMAFRRYMLRLYMNRTTENYCALYQGFFRKERQYFTADHVRVRPSRGKFDFANIYLGGRPTALDFHDFKHFSDYTTMIRKSIKSDEGFDV